MRTAVVRPRLRLAAVLLVAVVAVSDSAPATQGPWRWWQPQPIATLTSITLMSNGQPVAVEPMAAPCGIVSAQRFDPRLLCPADLGTHWSAIDVPMLLLAGCEPYGRMDAAGLTDGTTVLFEHVVDTDSRRAALA